MNNMDVNERLSRWTADRDWWREIDNPALREACESLDEQIDAVASLAYMEAIEDAIDEREAMERCLEAFEVNLVLD